MSGRPAARPLRVLHLVGSAVSEFHADLSRLYARDCLRATADPTAYEPHIAYVSPDGRWRFPSDLTPQAIAAAPSLPLPEALARLADLAPDVMVPQMFCLPGMTSYRSLFDVLGVPYVGNPAEVMALAADKVKTKAVVAAAGIAVPQGEVVHPGGIASLEPPVVVKPVDADNSLGVTLVRTRAEYDAALRLAWEHGRAALVETYVELGREVRCATLVRDGELVLLPLEEYRVDPEHKPVRDVADKLARRNDGDLLLVAKDPSRAWILEPSDPITTEVWTSAWLCHSALGCRGYGLFDFRIDPAGRPWFLEAGLYCSFAESSVVSVMARAAGIDLPDLFGAAVRDALAHRDTYPPVKTLQTMETP